MANDEARDATNDGSDSDACAVCEDRPRRGYYCADCGAIGAD